MNTNKRLCDLFEFECARILFLETSGDMRRRLLDHGLTCGTEERCIGRSPLGDPRAYLIRDKVIAIRDRDAEKIIVEGSAGEKTRDHRAFCRKSKRR